MTLSIQELSDRHEINDLMTDYCTAIDSKDFDALDQVFTRDAHIDYSAFGGAVGTFSEIKEYLKKSLVMFPAHQHLVSNVRIWLDGDTGRARSMCHNPMVIGREGDNTQTAFFGLWYADELVRTPQGWRLSKRVVEGCYVHNLPEDFTAVPP